MGDKIMESTRRRLGGESVSAFLKTFFVEGKFGPRLMTPDEYEAHRQAVLQDNTSCVRTFALKGDLRESDGLSQIIPTSTKRKCSDCEKQKGKFVELFKGKKEKKKFNKEHQCVNAKCKYNKNFDGETTVLSQVICIQEKPFLRSNFECNCISCQRVKFVLEAKAKEAEAKARELYSPAPHDHDIPHSP